MFCVQDAEIVQNAYEVLINSVLKSPCFYDSPVYKKRIVAASFSLGGIGSLILVFSFLTSSFIG